ncbi:MAG TPA: hypothetical protein VFN91_18100 [Myxococcaceae bacterium]|nr:hypothetical protein [Myxococcaceae bacterium]
MSASSRRPTSRFHSGMAARYACTGAFPSAFAICGLPPERRAGLAAAWRLVFLVAGECPADVVRLLVVELFLERDGFLTALTLALLGMRFSRGHIQRLRSVGQATSEEKRTP